MATKDSFVPVQLYVSNDAYHYTVDNRPLQDIITNLNFLADTFDTSIASYTPQSVIFASGTGLFTQDNASFNYNSTTKVLTVSGSVNSGIFKGPILDSNAATALLFKTNNVQQFNLGHTASAVNFFSTTGSIASSGLVLSATGTDTDISTSITPKGVGLNILNNGVARPSFISPAQITGNVNNYSPSGAAGAAVFRVNSDASRNITGLAGGAAGREVMFINVGTQNIVFTNEDANSTAANRFLTGSGPLTLNANSAVTFWYDSTLTRWIAFNTANVAGAANIQTLTDGATINWDASLGEWAVVTLTASGHTFGAPTNMVDGKEYTLFVIQDAGGSKTVNWNAVHKFPGGSASVILSTGANAVDMFSFKRRAGNLYGGFLKTLS
jgi:hypothetical protein